jgi:hypothetical protein
MALNSRPAAPSNFADIIIAAPPATYTVNNYSPVDAALEVQTTTGMVLFPRMTTAQRDLLNVVNGSQIYNSTTNTMQVYTNGAWASISTGGAGGNVVGTGPTTVGHLAVFNNALGTGIQDGGIVPPVITGTPGDFMVFNGSGNPSDSGLHLTIDPVTSNFLIVPSASTGAEPNNIALGYGALEAIDTGTFNIGIGVNAGAGTTDGNENIFIGHAAGTSNITGSGITCIGSASVVDDGLTNPVIIGTDASSTGSHSVAIGDTAFAAGGSGIAIGQLSQANTNSSTGAIAIGPGASAADASCIAIGNEATTTAGVSVFGVSIAIGNNATVAGDGSIAMGNFANVTADKAVAIGGSAAATVANTMILGGVSGTSDALSIGIGTSTPAAVLDVTSANSGLLVPRVANTGAVTSPVNGMIVYDNSATAFKFRQAGAWVALGSGSGNVVGPGTSVVGDIATYNNTTGTLIKDSGLLATVNSVTGDFSLSATASGSSTYDISIGHLAAASAGTGIAIGNSATTSGGKGIAIGDTAAAAGSQAIAMGYNSTASFGGSIAIGDTAGATAANAVAIGINASATVASTMILGGTGANAVSIGVGTSTPAASALLDLTSTTKALLVPRTTTASIVTPANGMIIYDTGTTAIMVYQNTAWVAVGGGNVTGPGTSVVGDIATYNNTTGTLIKDSGALLAVNSVAGNLSLSAPASGSSTNNINIGNSTSATGPNAIAIGFNTNANITSGLAIGTSTNATHQNAVAIGPSSFASGDFSTALGYNAHASATNATALGESASATVANTLILGGTGADAVSVGIGTSTPAAVLDVTATTTGILVPRTTTASVTSPVNGMVIYDTGTTSFQFRQNGAWVALSAGSGNVTGPGTSIAGDIATYNNTTGTLIKDSGLLLTVNATNGNFTLSTTASGTSTYAINIGNGNTATSNESIAIGNTASATGGNCTAIGSNSTAGASALAVGQGANASGTQGVAIGPAATASQTNTIAIGNSSATALAATAVGASAGASGSTSTCIGFNTHATQTNSTAIGAGATASVANSVVLGATGTQVYFTGGILVERTATAVTYSALVTDYIIACTASTLTIHLPTAAAGNSGQTYIIKDESGVGGSTVNVTGGGNIDGAATAALGAYGIVRVYSNGTQWFTW